MQTSGTVFAFGKGFVGKSLKGFFDFSALCASILVYWHTIKPPDIRTKRPINYLLSIVSPGGLSRRSVFFMIEKESYSSQPDKPQKLLEAIKELTLVSEKMGEFSDSRNRCAFINNIGICYHLLYKFNERFDDARQYLYSANSIYYIIINKI